jgi:hypothetical protein
MTLDEKEKALTSDIFELHTPDIDSFQFLATGDIVKLFCKILFLTKKKKKIKQFSL